MRISLLTVGLLATLGLVGCGVGGVEDPEGQQALSDQQQATGASDRNRQPLEGLEGKPGPTDEMRSPAPSGTGGRKDTSPSALPQDPTPLRAPNPFEPTQPLPPGAPPLPPRG